MVSQMSIIYAYKVNDPFYLLCLSTRGRGVVKKVQKPVYVVVECPLTLLRPSHLLFHGVILGKSASALA